MKKQVYLMLMVAMLVFSGNVQAALPVTNGLVMHLDASSISAADGAPVDVWTDLSGAGNDATQETAANQPIFVASSPDFSGGRSVVRFDGTDDWMTLSSTMINVGSFTMFAVAQFDDISVANGNQYIVNGQDGGGDDRIRFQLDTTITPVKFLWRVGNSAWQGITSDADLDVHVFGATSVAEGFLDGSSVGTATNSSTENPTAFNIGSYNRGEKDFFLGDLAELVVFNRVLTAQEIADMTAYLAVNTGAPRATNPNPGNGDSGVGTPAGGDDVEVTLQWDAVADENNPTQVDPAVKKHYLYMDTPTDANLVYVDEIPVTDWNTLTASYGPLTLGYDESYRWLIEEGLDDGQGGVYGPGDPNNYSGAVWSFSTIASVPVIDPQPVNTMFDEGDASVSLTLSATSGFPPEVYQWYKGASQISNGAKYQGADTDTLVVLNPDLGDEDVYYCKVTAANNGVTDSDTAMLKMKRLVAGYQFEQNADDSTGVNNGTVIGALPYTSDVLVTLDGQAYAADPNGSVYVELPADAYPKAGFGEALEEGSIAFWMKLDPTMVAIQSVLGSFNDGSTQGLQLQAYYNGIVRCYMRDEAGGAMECRSANEGINDSQWHYIVLTYQIADAGSSAAIYIDGEPSGSSTGTVSPDQLIAWQYPMTLLARNSRGTIGENCQGVIDDLRIYNYTLSVEQIAQTYYDVTGEQSCVLEYADTFDVTGPESVPDCIINLYDFAEMAAAWLDSGLYPN